MSELKLKPCPFCGNDKPVIYPPVDDPCGVFKREKGRAYIGQVFCSCGAGCNAKFYTPWPNKAREAVAEIWNRRI